MRRTLILVLSVALVSIAMLMVTAGDSPTSTQEVSAEAQPSTTSTTIGGPTKAEIKKLNDAVALNTWNQAVWVNKTNEATWIAKTSERLAAEQAAREAREAQGAAARAPADPSPQRSAPAAEQGTGRCGGNLPPCCVMNRESGGNIHAQNPTSSASGKWQALDSTWNGYGGYAHASDAPESVQDAFAAQLWAGGAGASHWGGGC